MSRKYRRPCALIEGVSTSTAAFVGVTDKGAIPGRTLPNGRMAQPGLVTSLTEYTRRSGGFRPRQLSDLCRGGFLRERRATTLHSAGGPRRCRPARSGDRPRPLGSALHPSAANEGAWGHDIWLTIADSSDGDTANHFKLQVMYGTTAADARANLVESYDNVTFRSATPTAPIPANYVRTLVNSRSEYIAVTGGLDSAAGQPGDGPASGRHGRNGHDRSHRHPVTGSNVTGTGLHALDKSPMQT